MNSKPGDLLNNHARLLTLLKTFHCPPHLLPTPNNTFLPALQHIILPLNQHLTALGYNLLTQNHNKLLKTIYQVALREFNHKPKLSIEQFEMKESFVEQKCILLYEIGQCVMKKLRELGIDSKHSRGRKQSVSPHKHKTRSDSRAKSNASSDYAPRNTLPIPTETSYVVQTTAPHNMAIIKEQNDEGANLVRSHVESNYSPKVQEISSPPPLFRTEKPSPRSDATIAQQEDSNKTITPYHLAAADYRQSEKAPQSDTQKLAEGDSLYTPLEMLQEKQTFQTMLIDIQNELKASVNESRLLRNEVASVRQTLDDVRNQFEARFTKQNQLISELSSQLTARLKAETTISSSSSETPQRSSSVKSKVDASRASPAKENATPNTQVDGHLYKYEHSETARSHFKPRTETCTATEAFIQHISEQFDKTQRFLADADITLNC